MIFPAIWRICGSEELRMLTPAAWQISIPHLSTSAASIQIAGQTSCLLTPPTSTSCTTHLSMLHRALQQSLTDYVPATLNPLSAVKQMRHRKRPSILFTNSSNCHVPTYTAPLLRASTYLCLIFPGIIPLCTPAQHSKLTYSLLLRLYPYPNLA